MGDGVSERGLGTLHGHHGKLEGVTGIGGHFERLKRQCGTPLEAL